MRPVRLQASRCPSMAAGSRIRDRLEYRLYGGFAAGGSYFRSQHKKEVRVNAELQTCPFGVPPIKPRLQLRHSYKRSEEPHVGSTDDRRAPAPENAGRKAATSADRSRLSRRRCARRLPG